MVKLNVDTIIKFIDKFRCGLWFPVYSYFKNMVYVLSVRKRTHATMITSTDGAYAVPNKAKMIAKKPGQRKRPRTEK
jgi:hypothetical protein